MIFVALIAHSNLFYRFVVTMKNGDLDSKGLLSMIVRQKGTNETFQVSSLVCHFDFNIKAYQR